MRLWLHDTWNEIGDVLTTEEDRLILVKTLRSLMNRNMNVNIDVLLGDLQGSSSATTIEKLGMLVWSDILSVTNGIK